MTSLLPAADVPAGAGAENLLEVAVQMGLIAEADGGRRQAWRHAVEQEAARQVDPAARHVPVRADPELPGEHPHQVGRVGVEGVRRLPEGHLLAEPGVDQFTQLMREAGSPRGRGRLAALTQVAPEPFGDECQAAFGFEFLAGLFEQVVQLVDAVPQERVGQHGPVDGLAGEAGRQLREIEVDDPLAETRGRGDAPVVRHLRGQQRDDLVQGAVLVTVQVIADDPVVDDQQRPGFVRVHGIDVAGHARVEDLDDAGNPRPPCPDPRAIGHAKIVQDSPAAGRVRSDP